MNDDRSARDVAAVLAGLAPTRSPDTMLEDVFQTTSRMRPRPRWLALIKEPPMRHSSRVAVGSPTFRLVTATALTLVLLLGCLAAIGVGARVLATNQLPAPFGPVKTGPLVYSAGGDIYLANADGSEPHAIITGAPLDQVPYFSLEGTKLAFGRGSENARSVWVADADGSNSHRVLRTANLWFEWLPGGEQMAVAQGPYGEGRLSIMDVGTGDTIREFDLGSISVDWWVWPRPPEGRELVFRGRPDTDSSDIGMYAIGVDGSGLRMVGELATNESDAQVSFLDPSISPDGSTIAYWNQEPGSPAARESGAYVHLRDLATGVELPVPFDRAGWRPVFSPDGMSILYERGADGGQLYLVPVDGSRPAEPVGPTFPGDQDHVYGFSPDGAEVLLVQVGKTTIIDIATGSTTELSGSGGPEAGGWQRLAS